VFAIARSFQTSAEHKEECLEYPNYSSIITLCRDLDSKGSISLKNGEAHVQWSLGKLDANAQTAGIVSGTKVLLAAGAKKVSTAQELGLSFVRTNDSYEETGIKLITLVASNEFKQYVENIHRLSIVQTKTPMFSAHV
jgi:inorganic pyrophosphatase/exopolyphosphatase